MSTDPESTDGRGSGLSSESQEPQAGGPARWKVALAVVAAIGLVAALVLTGKDKTPQYSAAGAADQALPAAPALSGPPPPADLPLPTESVVLATVNGEDITSVDLVKALRALPDEVRPAFQDNQPEFLDGLVMRKLLVQEIRRRAAAAGGAAPLPAEESKAVNDFLDKEVLSHVQATDDDVRAFYDAHKDQIAGSPSFEDVKEKLKPYAEAVKQREALRKYLDGVRKAATVTLNDAWVAEQRAKAADNPLARALKTGRPVLVDFASANSEPCVQMAPTLKALAEEYSGRAEVVVVDIQQYPNVARRCGIESTPAQIFYDSSGKEVAPRHAGFMSREDMVGRLKGMGVE